MKEIIVQKFGGTSVGDIDKIKNVARRIVDTKNKGYDVIVTVSAMGKTTDVLVEKAFEISQNPSSREMDMLLATGEQVSIALLAMAIQSLGHPVISLTGAQCGIKTDSSHKKARINNIDTKRLQKELGDGKIVIVAGFQGINENQDITTLGRGGSDTTAVAIAAAIGAAKCEIYTDVDGVYTADPRKVKEASLMKRISYDEMLELANLGAGVLHPRSVELARKFNVPLVVRSSFNDNEGTEIVNIDQIEKVVVRGISLDDDIAKVSVLGVPDRPGIAFKLFSILSMNNINVDMIIQNVNRESINDISFTVKKDDLADFLKISDMLLESIGAEKITYDDSVAKLSIVGTGIAGNTEVTSKFFETLYELGVNIQMISTSSIKISCIIDREGAEKGMDKLHEKFQLN
ncbi:aspartate kinase [Peptoclostridium litorale DSM 5388]|uniref:Aspartokinase n=1 Tax=Peptoclostridium litorale DSM 5388 TaxID=1121324 RepID=A0A069RED0_PEPLI|nr:aspartate kinase [Peptoclostridium litorale]KDR93969.1 aspartokinase LysC [Peptoclostridium litorale DSM 5388]KDR95396.1 aspartokinase LysC [Peptoclostridium litorale DSM 5388]SIN89524.1 aspartate kinase [Peptoclostridium litorale DSM 5388]